MLMALRNWYSFITDEECYTDSQWAFWTSLGVSPSGAGMALLEPLEFEDGE